MQIIEQAALMVMEVRPPETEKKMSGINFKTIKTRGNRKPGWISIRLPSLKISNPQKGEIKDLFKLWSKGRGRSSWGSPAGCSGGKRTQTSASVKFVLCHENG